MVIMKSAKFKGDDLPMCCLWQNWLYPVFFLHYLGDPADAGVHW